MTNDKTFEKIQWYRGDTFPLEVVFKDENEVPIDITTWIVWLTLKKKQSYPDAQATIQVENGVGDHADPTGGVTILKIDSSATKTYEGQYYFDVQYKDDDDAIVTVQKGIVEFVTDITITET